MYKVNFVLDGRSHGVTIQEDDSGGPWKCGINDNSTTYFSAYAVGISVTEIMLNRHVQRVSLQIRPRGVSFSYNRECYCGDEVILDKALLALVQMQVGYSK